MLLTKEGHIKLTDFGLSRISMPEQESENQNPQEMLKHLDGISMRFNSSSILKTIGGTSPGSSSLEAERRILKRRHDSSIRNKQILGTPDYLAPELLMGLSHGTEVDWWALGICIFEWLLGYPPFTDTTPELIFRNILSHDIEWPVDELTHNSMDLITHLLNTDTSKRSRAEDVKKHPLFDELDWETIRDQPAPFKPKPTNTTDTSYFDERGGRPDPTKGSDERKSTDSEKNRLKESTESLNEVFTEFSYTNVNVLGARNLSLKFESEMDPLIVQQPAPSLGNSGNERSGATGR
jgi:serine/threonine protein kinase